MLKEKIRIMLVDDHPMFLNGLSVLLKSDPLIEVVATAAGGEEALNILATHTVDVLVTDISMPEMDGIKLNTVVKAKYPKVKSLILSTHNDPERISKLIQKDVDGYLLKNAEKEEFVVALAELQNGKKYFSPEVKEKYVNSLFESKPEPQVKLSRREKEILKYLVKELTAKEIGEALFISAHTVNTHKKNLMAKLNAKNSAGLITYAMKHGLVD